VLIKTLGFAFDVVAKAIDPVIDVVFSLMGAFAKLGSFLVKTAGFVLDVVGKMVNGVIAVINKAIDGANKLNPFSDIPKIDPVSIGSASLGGAPTAPTQGGVDTPGRNDRIAAGVPTIPSGTGVIVPEIPSAGGGGGSSRAGGGTRTVIGSTAGLIAAGESASMIGVGGIDFSNLDLAALESSMGTNVSITVNTVSADANLPNLIVDALQQYNLVSGPLDVQIAV